MVPLPRFRRLALIAGLGLAVAGCDTVGGLFGSPAEETLPGERISVLPPDRGLSVEPAVRAMPVRLPEPYVNERWTHQGGSPAHTMYHLALQENPRRQWTADVGAGSRSDRRLLSQPLVVDGRVYTMDALSVVKAFDSADGDTLWERDLEPEDEDDGYFGGGIAYDSGRIFVTTGFAKVFALDAATGEVLWVRSVTAPLRAAPTAAGGRVVVITIENETIALDAGTGKQLWTHNGIQELTTLIGAASPAILGSIVVAPYSSGEIYGLLAENGRVLWSDSLSSIRRTDPLADIAQIRGAPVIDRDMVYAVSHSGRMIAIDLRRGLRAWEREIGGVEMPWAGGDFVYVLTNEAQIVCLTRKDGQVRWVRALPRFEDPEDQEDPIRWRGPVLAGDRLIVAGSDERVLAISPYTGEMLGAIELPDAVSLAPVVADNALFFLTDGGTLVAMR